MKKIIVLLMVCLFAYAPSAFAGSYAGKVSSRGPAPNSGDCIPDGSGFDDEAYILESLGFPYLGPGAAPNSGDGIPDGSGWEVPPQGTK
jgi:hypothetical protein